MNYEFALITQDRRFEKIMQRISDYFGCELTLYENCGDFVKGLGEDWWGVVVVDGYVCDQPRLMDLQMVLNKAPALQAHVEFDGLTFLKLFFVKVNTLHSNTVHGLVFFGLLTNHHIDGVSNLTKIKISCSFGGRKTDGSDSEC